MRYKQGIGDGPQTNAADHPKLPSANLVAYKIDIYWVKSAGFSCLEWVVSSVDCQIRDLFTLLLYVNFVIIDFSSII
jgi:hypothetical protein